MDNNIYNGAYTPVLVESEKVVQPEIQRNPFILGNTVEVDLQTLQDAYLTPVFSRDNVETISHSEFISTVFDAAQTYFQGQQFNMPIARCSHELKLRTRNGSGASFGPEDSRSYMQRMMFMIEIPSISSVVNGNLLHLQIVGVHNYADINLLGNSTQKQSFSCAIGFINTVCVNGLCRSQDSNLSIKVTNTADLYKCCMDLFRNYNFREHLEEMKALNNTIIDVPTLAQFLGRAKMAANMSASMKSELGIPEFILPEAQLNSMVRDYYTDENFGGFGRSISAWQFYQLLTNYKNNYIDLQIPRAINAWDATVGITKAINHEDDAWQYFIS